jgi:lambda repressor-like predicted transcriptional regulator
MKNSKISLQKWFLALYIASNHKKGISSLQLSRDLGVTQKTAWFILHRIREMLRDKAPAMLRNVVEIDETFIGGKNKNRHADKKVAKQSR